MKTRIKVICCDGIEAEIRINKELKKIEKHINNEVVGGSYPIKKITPLVYGCAVLTVIEYETKD